MQRAQGKWKAVGLSFDAVSTNSCQVVCKPHCSSGSSRGFSLPSPPPTCADTSTHVALLQTCAISMQGALYCYSFNGTAPAKVDLMLIDQGPWSAGKSADAPWFPAGCSPDACGRLEEQA